MPEIYQPPPLEELPLGRCLCTWWRVARKDYFKATCVACNGTIRPLDAVDRLVWAGRLEDVTMRDFATKKREHDGWASQ